MRSPYEPSLAPWMTRILSPWLVATFGGLCIGTALMRIDNPAIPNLSPDLAPRAAMYDESPANPSEFNGTIADAGALDKLSDLSLPPRVVSEETLADDQLSFGADPDAAPSSAQDKVDPR